MTGEPKFSPTLAVSTAQRMATWARHTQARAVVRHAVVALGNSVRAMPLKGVLLGALQVVHPAMRPLRDADLLISGRGLTYASRVLGRAGFRITDIPWSHGYLSFAHRDFPDLWLDLHTVVMPIGLGRLRPSYLFANADLDDGLFGATVHVPRRAALMVHLLANVVKDRVVHAFDHVPNDLAHLARSLSAEDEDRVVADVLRLALGRGAALALTWAHAATEERALARLLVKLVPSTLDRHDLARTLRAMATADQGRLADRVRARAAADQPWLQLAAAAFTATSLVSYPIRKAWLLANNRGDASPDLR